MAAGACVLVCALTAHGVQAQTEVWRARYNHGDDFAAAVSTVASCRQQSVFVDGAGNSYLAASQSNGSNNDFLTVKYDATGAVVWAKRFDRAGAEDRPCGVVVDTGGSVYVTGISFAGGNADFLTIKYDASGTQQWAKTFDGSGGVDQPTALAADGSGGVVVTGVSFLSSNDYMTVRYDSAGNLLWSRALDGPGGSVDVPAGVAVDAAGDVVVTGKSKNGSNYDYLTVEYDGAGAQQWTATYSGPSGGDDVAIGVAVDGGGDVYVAGSSRNGAGDDDFLTVSYNATGVQQWAIAYAGASNGADVPSAVAVDPTGGVVVSGYSFVSGSNDDYATIKYDATGTQQWAALYDRAGLSDRGNALAVDATGNVFVAGRSFSGSDWDYTTLKYGSDGHQIWASSANSAPGVFDEAFAVALDGAGDVVVTGVSQTTIQHVRTVKYDASGVQQWSVAEPALPTQEDAGTSAAAPFPADVKHAFAVDASGNSYLTGSFQNGSGSNWDYLTVKYNSSGVLQWAVPFNGSGNLMDQASALAVDGSGNVYVTGWSWSGTDYDYLTIKYDSAGVQQWSRSFNRGSNLNDQATAIAVDASGNSYVTGSSSNGTNLDYVTIKYDPSGTQQWGVAYATPYADQAFNVAVDSSGNVYVTGQSVNPAGSYNIVTIKYDSAGAQQWAASYNGAFSGYDTPNDLAVDGSGNVYVVGYSQQNPSNGDLVAIKYDSSGAQQWATLYENPAAGAQNDQGTSVAIDAGGNVYVAGYTQNAGGTYDYLTVKLSSSGVQQWASIFNGAANNHDYAYALALDGSGNAYVTGQSFNGANFDIATVKYDSNGVQQWVKVLDGGDQDTGYGVALAPGNSLVVAANSSGRLQDYLLVKYTRDIPDTTPPVVTVTGPNPQTIECHTGYTEHGATALDDVDGDLTSAISVDASQVNANVPGDYTVTYTVQDAAHNIGTATRTVQVRDTTLPSLVLNPPNPQSLECRTPYVELGATASDVCSGSLTGAIQIDASVVNANAVGSYTVSYSVADGSLNTAHAVRFVNVVDTTNPTLTLQGANPQTVVLHTPYSELGATASDLCAGNLTGAIQIDASAVDVDTPGSYLVHYTVNDGNGHSVSANRTVNVAATAEVYFVDYQSAAIHAVGSNGGAVSTPVPSNSGFGVAVDPYDRKLYYFDGTTGTIRRADLDGSNSVPVVAAAVGSHDLAVSKARDRIVWTDWAQQEIRSARLDGSDVRILASGGIQFPGSVAIDEVAGVVYWADYYGKRIERVALDGTGRAVVLDANPRNPYGLTLDVAAHQIYWTAGSTNEIRRVGFDGTGDLQILGGEPGPADITFDPQSGYLFWVQEVASAVRRAKTDGSGAITIATAPQHIYGIAVLSDVPLADQAPSFTSAAAATFAAGAAGTFRVTALGVPNPALGESGGLPPGVAFSDHGDGTGDLSGTPAAGSGGLYAVQLQATNGVAPDATQSFALTVTEAPAITSASATTFTAGAAGTFTPAATGYPSPTITVDSGTLPSGVSFTAGSLSGTPAAGTGGTYNLVFRAANGVNPDATQSFTLTVNEAPAITSANATTFTAGAAGSFTPTASGYPAPAITLDSGTLPSGVSFTAGSLGGTPAAGTGGTYNLVFRAANSVNPDATQSFTLTVEASPGITSANAATFTTGTAGSFTPTATGYPAPTITLDSGTLPSGVSFTAGSLGGTPAAGTGGTYNLVFRAANGVNPDATQSFTLTVDQAPAFTSGGFTTFAVGAAGSFTIMTSGSPPAALSVDETLPSGLTFTDHGDGTASLAGTPGAGTGGAYALTFRANNGVGGDVTQSFTLTINQDLAITSGSTTTFTVGVAGTFTVTTSGFPLPALSETGALPSGVTLVDNGDGTATLAGTPAAATGGSYSLTLKAHNAVSPDALQAFTLTVNQSAAITSASLATFAVGSSDSFTVTTSGSPAPSLGSTGTLPAGVTFTDNGDGTATLAGTAAAATGGVYPLSFTATNGVGAPALQSFTLTIDEAPAITSANATTLTTGAAGSFTPTATGYPSPTITLDSGTLPSGVSFTAGSLSGTPAAGTGGTYSLVFRAANGVNPDATQSFTLTVNEAPVITSANATTFTAGATGSFTPTASGYPAPTITLDSGTLPSGVSFTGGSLSGTPAAGTGGTYSLVFRAANGVLPEATQSFTLTVNEAPVITSANATTFTTGAAGSFTPTATGYPLPTITLDSGTLPSGVSFTAGSLSGTPAAGTGGTYSLVFRAANGVLPEATQSFTLTVHEAPAITSANSTTFTTGAAGSFTPTATGYPSPTITLDSGTLPSGVSFTAGSLSGTPAAGTGGTYSLVFRAANGVLPEATQSFTLTVHEAPAITSANSTTFTLASPGTFTVTATGFPIPVLSRTGALPSGVTFVDNGDGTATLAGTPAAGTAGSYPLTLQAGNGVGTDASQSFTLVVSGGVFFTLTPCRAFDSRLAGDAPALASGVTRVIALAGRCGIPATAKVVSVNITMVSPPSAGFLQAFAGDQAPPATSVLNVSAGRTRANNALVELALDASGTLALRPVLAGGGSVDVVVDVNGYFE